MLEKTYPFELPPLPYDASALEPYIDAETMHLHHDKHFQAYLDNLNAALAPYPALHHVPLQRLLLGHGLPKKDRTAILHNAGGVYNHALFFDGLLPAGDDAHHPTGVLESSIIQTFGSVAAFQRKFHAQAMGVFGSGWTMLARDGRGRLHLLNLKDQDTVVPFHLTPLLIVDVWEHAYYLQYQNRRADYLDAIQHVLRYPCPVTQA